jgi:hypothetical protein
MAWGNAPVAKRAARLMADSTVRGSLLCLSYFFLHAGAWPPLHACS